MTRSHGFPAAATLLVVVTVALAPPGDAARPVADPPLIAIESDATEGLVGPFATPAPSKVLQDTVWIADWSFDAPGGGCTSTGWTVHDNRVLGDPNIYWRVDDRFDAAACITNNAAYLRGDDPCWSGPGYGNDWDQSIVLQYSGAATLSFDYASETEPSYDFVYVEADSLGLSDERINLCTAPSVSPTDLRDNLLTIDGLVLCAHVGPIALPDYGPGTHEVLIRLDSDGVSSPEDAGYPSTLGAGLVVDNIVVTGGIAYGETFESPMLDPHVALRNTASLAGFCNAPWLRLVRHITDNEKCGENTTCAWLDTDPSFPALQPSMAFGPGGAVVRPWIDDLLVSPWVALPPGGPGTNAVLSFRRFPGNNFGNGQIVQGWRVRSLTRKDNTETPAPGDSVDCVGPWRHASQFNSLSVFAWLTSIFDMTSNLASNATAIQVSFRTVDWQVLVGIDPVATLNPGPGPYTDRVRIGRRVLAGPFVSVGIDTRTQAQDCFPTVHNPSIAPGEHFEPDGVNRFGSCAFSWAQDLGTHNISPRLITGDSIILESVTDVRQAGGIATVRLYAAIVDGPHASKVPGPFTPSGEFFAVNAEPARNSNGTIVANRWFVDFDDTYFRGGDVLQYVWCTTDNGGGFTSAPYGLSAAPVSVAAAEAAVGGLYEVNYLPVIDWDPAYLAAVAAHPTGDVAPTAEQIAASAQRNCILYYQKLNSNRRSGAINRTSFMYTLDQLGYAGHYDVYDVQGYGNTVNQLAGRANVGQCSGYALIVQDDGRSTLVPNIPGGEDGDSSELDQAGWYRSYLAQGASGLAATASLWIQGESTAYWHTSQSTNAIPLLTIDVGLTSVVQDQGLAVSPSVDGQSTFTWAAGVVSDFSNDVFALAGGCPAVRLFDAAEATNGAVVTHRYASAASVGGGAIVLNRNTTLEWNTIWMGFAWFDIRDASGALPVSHDTQLMAAMLAGVLPEGCLRSPVPTGLPDPDPRLAAPAVTALHPNVPNPFNPATRIDFDLAVAGHAHLRIFDAAGRAVRTLVDEARPPGRYSERWTGLDAGGSRVASGVYFYKLEAPGFESTRKMVLLQ